MTWLSQRGYLFIQCPNSLEASIGTKLLKMRLMIRLQTDSESTARRANRCSRGTIVQYWNTGENVLHAIRTKWWNITSCVLRAPMGGESPTRTDNSVHLYTSGQVMLNKATSLSVTRDTWNCYVNLFLVFLPILVQWITFSLGCWVCKIISVW